MAASTSGASSRSTRWPRSTSSSPAAPGACGAGGCAASTCAGARRALARPRPGGRAASSAAASTRRRTTTCAARGAVVFPELPDVPVDAYRERRCTRPTSCTAGSTHGYDDDPRRAGLRLVADRPGCGPTTRWRRPSTTPPSTTRSTELVAGRRRGRGDGRPRRRPRRRRPTARPPSWAGRWPATGRWWRRAGDRGRWRPSTSAPALAGHADAALDEAHRHPRRGAVVPAVGRRVGGGGDRGARPLAAATAASASRPGSTATSRPTCSPGRSPSTSRTGPRGDPAAALRRRHRLPPRRGRHGPGDLPGRLRELLRRARRWWPRWCSSGSSTGRPRSRPGPCSWPSAAGRAMATRIHLVGTVADAARLLGVTARANP